jgi:hypothetical protein
MDFLNTKWLLTGGVTPECEITFHSDGTFSCKPEGQNYRTTNTWKGSSLVLFLWFKDASYTGFIGADITEITGLASKSHPPRGISLLSIDPMPSFNNFVLTRIPDINLSNTKWRLHDNINNTSSIFDITCHPGGSFSYSDEGSISEIGNQWKVEGSQITFTINNRYSTYIGTLKEGLITGTLKNSALDKGYFVALQKSDFGVPTKRSNDTYNTVPSWVDTSVKFEISETKGNRSPNGVNFETFSLSYYYPKNKYPTVLTPINSERQFIYDFKDGIGSTYEKAAIKLGSAIVNNFLPKVLNDKNRIICIIPASTEIKTHIRYYNFCEKISNLLGYTNGYNFIRTTKDSKPSHLGGRDRGDISNISISDTLIKDKTIYLFDDIITSGKTFFALAVALRKAGAKEVIGFFLGKTYDGRKLEGPN